MQAIDVAELGVDGLVEVLIELRAERVHLTAGVLALVEVEREQVLQIVAAGASRRREHVFLELIGGFNLGIVDADESLARGFACEICEA